MPLNDNDSAVQGDMPNFPDAHGHAALLLVESLLHGLCEKSTLSTSEAIEIAERAVSVQIDQADEAGGAGTPMWRSYALLSNIAASLKIDADVVLPLHRLVP